jgi:hypothetical protein
VPSDPKGYNGLKSFGGQVHDLGASRPSREQVIQQAFSAQLQALMREMYVRAIADTLRHGDAEDCEPGYYRELAQECQVAALAYFEGLGMIETRPAEPTAPAP